MSLNDDPQVNKMVDVDPGRWSAVERTALLNDSTAERAMPMEVPTAQAMTVVYRTGQGGALWKVTTVADSALDAATAVRYDAGVRHSCDVVIVGVMIEETRR